MKYVLYLENLEVEGIESSFVLDQL